MEDPKIKDERRSLPLIWHDDRLKVNTMMIQRNATLVYLVACLPIR